MFITEKEEEIFNKEPRIKLDENRRIIDETETQETVYDVIISFTSRASGIDRDIKDKVDKILSNFNAENENKIKPEIAPWGREGEVDYHFITKNLSTNQKKALTTKIKEAIGSSDTVFILFNKKAVHKR